MKEIFKAQASKPATTKVRKIDPCPCCGKPQREEVVRLSAQEEQDERDKVKIEMFLYIVQRLRARGMDDAAIQQCSVRISPAGKIMNSVTVYDDIVSGSETVLSMWPKIESIVKTYGYSL